MHSSAAPGPYCVVIEQEAHQSYRCGKQMCSRAKGLCMPQLIQLTFVAVLTDSNAKDNSMQT